MTAPALTPLQAAKNRIREQAHVQRDAQPDKDELSHTILAAFMALPEYRAAPTILFYMDVRSEVRTRHGLQCALSIGKKIVVPWCTRAGELELFHLEAMEELATGRYEILEPKRDL